MPEDNTKVRKDEHIRINLEEDVSFDHLRTGFERYQFTHQALPELSLQAVNTESTFLHHPLAFPVLISSMTGGTRKTARINQILAEVAQEMGIGMGLGSMRAALESREVAWTFQVRRYAPDILLLANLGAVQLNYGYGPEVCQQAVDLVQADGLILHLNPLQEALQPEGQTNFAGLLPRIEAVCKALHVPVIVKEVGWGLSKAVAQRLIDAGVAALDTAGAGGVSWSQVEMYRSRSAVQREVAAAFRDWGIPTVDAIQMVREIDSDIPLIASGGIHNGLEVAKALALGADITALAGALLPAATTSPEALRDKLSTIRRQLQVAMFAVGAATIRVLQHTALQKIST